MSSLKTLQQQFISALKQPAATDFLNLIRSSEQLSSLQHLAIYKNSIKGSLQNVLKEIFPVCQKIVGEDFFIMMINEYIAMTPSLSPDMGDYGQTLSQFISEFQPAKSIAYLSDVANLEWAWHRAFNSRDATELNLKKLSEYYTSHADNIVFLLPPSSTLLSSLFPIHAIWEFNQDSSNGNESLIIESKPHYYFICRDNDQVCINLLSYEQWLLLSWIQKKQTLGEISDKISTEYPQVSLENLLPTLVKENWLSDFVIQSKK